MLNGVQIIRIGVLVLATALLLSHVVFVPAAVSEFLSGGGIALMLVGAGKRFAEVRSAQ